MKLYEEPLIKAIETPIGKYFYDATRNEIIKVKDNLFRLIDEAVKSELNCPEDQEAFEEYGNLYDCGYFHHSELEKLEHGETGNLPMYLANKVGGIILQLTQQCNLRCGYCIYSENAFGSQRAHSSKRMSYDTAKNAIDFLYEHSPDTSEIVVGFYGGEPLLEFELLKKIVLYTNEKLCGKKIIYTLTSNATLLSNEIIDFLAEHEISLTISMDGPESIHDSNRVFRDGKGSFKTVKQNIDSLWNHAPEYAKTVSINMVVDPQNSFQEINKIFQETNIKKMRFQHSLIEREDGPALFSDEYLQEAHYQDFLCYLMEVGRIRKRHIEKLALDEMESLKQDVERIGYNPIHKVGAPAGPCIPGKKRLFCNVNGDLYPCERVSEKAECVHIGNIRTGFEIHKVDALLNISKLNERCKKCWAFSLCKTCVKAIVMNGELSLEKMLTNCVRVKRQAESRLRSKILISELIMHTADRWEVKS